MLTILSPAKKLLNIQSPYLGNSSQPKFLSKAHELIDILRTYSPSQISQLMKLSDTLAELNYQRYQGFYSDTPPSDSCYPAIFYFQGDVYQGLNAQSLSDDSIEFSNKHLSILSGLYGLLRPLDLIQAYRLEMGTKLQNPQGENLYSFWQDAVTQEINNTLDNHKNRVLLNLASTEYSKAIDTKKLKHSMLTIHFKESISGSLKTIGIHAKKARGLMARFILQNKIDDVEKLKSFCENQYSYSGNDSDNKNMLFIRHHHS